MQEKIIHTLRSQNIVFYLFVLIAFSLAWSTVKVIQRNYTLQQQVDAIAAEVSVLEVENQNLGFNIEYFKSDAYLELAAREKFNKAEAGETLVLPQKEASAKQSTQSENVDSEDNRPQHQQNIQQWKEFLFGIQS